MCFLSLLASESAQWHILILRTFEELRERVLNKNIGMYLDKKVKKDIFKKHGGSDTNTGSTEGQVALFTYRISHLTNHLKKNRKDFGTQRALQLLVGKRRSLLDYLKSKDIEKYRELVKELGLRR
jgi:small subunit ribosomal protein S15